MTASRTNEIHSAFETAMYDERLLRAPSFWAENWLEFVPMLGLSPESIRFIKLVEELHPNLSHGGFQVGGSGRRINPVELSKWLVRRAHQVGLERAYAELQDLEQNSEVNIFNVTLINGLDFKGVINFNNDIKLSSYDLLPDSIKSNVGQKVDSFIPNVHPPYTYLYQSYKADLISSCFGDDMHLALREYIKYEQLIVNYLSLYVSHNAPCVDKRWSLLEDHIPMAGLIDNSYGSYLEIIPPKICEDWSGIDTEEISAMYMKYIGIPEKMRLPLDISLWRRTQAINTWNNVNKAIDLGIALESILTVPDTREQLSLQVRVLGSKLVSSQQEKRRKAFSYLKTVYSIRSSAVHNGKVEQSYKVSGEGKINISAVLDEGITIHRDCMKEIIRRGGLSNQDIENIFIE